LRTEDRNSGLSGIHKPSFVRMALYTTGEQRSRHIRDTVKECYV
jgi:hypothetical protein